MMTFIEYLREKIFGYDVDIDKLTIDDVEFYYNMYENYITKH